ncbi:ParB/RepB/Spo0J family partition protein [Aurantimonas sp. C2-6-R+9]|uniref:ParB/RepB/Spo0J family partition protein n=1 Tax=unclassified Aurantimonas TaxID=2638230 RepID=UPI002E18230E|nr:MULTISPECIES: ParB/RepB/Spo0J family partition protein [unclassified Aurantimonas]MEC5292235.1 ParB/RepB/Spo0J family partition protein [Aurantimonas sp. C2-3-R2]MEC5382450.1 ParB/RepB/Spo0J family partition protein [Aurantimonas sp. C2-6-R+9]MEC5413320.1 ParB/RepB/Spo0J family partition protein [Aurantimonas sp. C2-4-R8]
MSGKKLTLSSSRDIPFNKLVLSQSNVRRIKSGVSIEEFAEDIARRGLLQSLHVRPVVDADGNETGMFEIPAGGRRYRALEHLVKAKRLNKTAPVPCVVREAGSDILAEDDSLAENTQREALHPLDQFRAFRTLREKGQSEEEIAAAFFVPVNVVKQRLRLAAVSPKLLDLYETDEISLDQVMTFTINPDHDRQEQVWEALDSSWSKDPYQIRRLLTETTVRASHKRAVFIGLAAYEEAGGTILRDLFQSDDGGWLQDAALLDRLATEKLKATAAEIAEEGWKWIEVAVNMPYDAAYGLRRIDGTPVDLTDEEQAMIVSLEAEYAKLEADHAEAEELPEAIDERLGEIETALATFETRPVIYDPDEIARAGVFVSIGGNGSLSIDRGYVRPEDEAPEDGEGATAGMDGSDASTGATLSVAGQSADPDDEEDEGIKPLPDRLVMELTAHRTLALRDAVAGNPHIAMTALLHKLVTDAFQRMSSAGGCLEASVHHVFFPAQSADLKDSPSAKSVNERQEAWKTDIPQDDQALWDWLDGLDDASRMALLAHCVSYGVNALYEKVDRYGAGLSKAGLERRLGQANRLAKAVKLDMIEAGWSPTAANYLGRVTKARIVEAVREGVGEQAAQLIDHLKKGDMAKEAERLLADNDWLPEPLRQTDFDDPAAEAGNDGGDALPEFLADGEDADTEEDEAEALVAAE